ncbi:hypothetical protein ILUMI_21126 [Ignelater luminosus]|uniref:Uncharacterized protein n=1 Tax=Ignelater luminosus TaxID=2038154 RepID=A0A8K0CF57_IGNLU|nr:hypothetical protein ILUMI_21126 [Ignelater luminosus]
MTQEILNLMEEGRLVKLKDPENYSEMQSKIGKKIRQAKEQYMTNKCKEIEDLNSKHTQREYLPETERSEIMQSEVEYAIKTTKGDKALGPDDIPIALLKIMERNRIQLLIAFFNKIYDTGVIPNEWLVSSKVSPMKLGRL